MKFSYISHSTAIPSRRAHGVQMMRACHAFVKQGADVRLLLPRGQKTPLCELGDFASVWDFYGIEPNFEIKHLPVGLYRSRRRFDIYTAVALLYALQRRDRLIYTRCLDIAFLTTRLGFSTVCETQTFAGFGGDKYNRLLPHWIQLVKNRPRRAAMVAATRVDAEEYIKLGFPSDRMLVVANGVNPQDFELAVSKQSLRDALSLPQSKLIVCYSGDLDEDKGIYEFLRCAQLHPDLMFLVVGGEPDDIAACQAFVQERHLGNVRFAGYVPHFLVPRYLLASDILVMPQIAHPKTDFPRSALKMFDYLASGRPIVSTDFPTVREIFAHKHNAFLVPPTGSESLALGIRYLLNHSDLAETLAQRATQDVQQYSWENRARRILTWVREIFNVL